MPDGRDAVAIISDYMDSLAGRHVEVDEPVISSRLLESIAAVQLIDFVESVFGVAVEDDDLVLANFDSVAAVAALVRSKLEVA